MRRSVAGISVLAWLALLLACHANGPVPRAVDMRLMLDRRAQQRVALQADVRIPDNSELNWPIQLPDSDLTVQSVQVQLRGLYHEFASDLVIKLLHGSAEVTLLERDGGNMTVGLPASRLRPDVAGYSFAPHHPAQGLGHTFTFADLPAENLALGRAASQSSTLYGGMAERAVDGEVDGRYSRGSVTHTGGHGTLDPQPWWMVDLGAEQPIGVLRLWNRVQEPSVDAVQRVTTRALSPLGGSFRLNVTFAGQWHVTAPIHHAAVASVTDEQPGAQHVGTGAGVGESMQARLQALPHVGAVEVAREPEGRFGGYSWFVTFVSNAGPVPPMEALTAGTLTGAGAAAEATLLRAGSANVWYNYKGEVQELSTRLLPAWVMVLAHPPADDSLAEARLAAVWQRRVTTPRRLTTLSLPANVTGRYVRVQLESAAYLSIAEVEVFAQRSRLVRHYQGGSPIVSGTYSPAEPLHLPLTGVPMTGLWVLSVRDAVAETVIHDDDSRPPRPVHGRGGLSDWLLIVTDSDGGNHTFRADVRAGVLTLPKYGKLYREEANGTLGEALVAEEGQEVLETECSQGCFMGRGHAVSTSGDGAVAALNVLDGDRALVYEPMEGFEGDDHFTYAIRVGVTHSAARGRVDLMVRDCRLAWCGNEYM